MGTLGCINDMLQRDKENRALRKRSRERMAETRNRLLDIGKGTNCSQMTVERMEDIRRKTLEKEALEKAIRWKAMLCFALGMVLILFLVGLLVGCSGQSSGNTPLSVERDSAPITQGNQTISVPAQDTIYPFSVASQLIKKPVLTEKEPSTEAEPFTEKAPFTEKELQKIQNELRKRYARSEIKGTRLDGNITGWGIQGPFLVVNLCLNSSEARAVFQKKVLDSPAIRFEGPIEPVPDHQQYTSDTLGIRLSPECSSYPYSAQTATFVLFNQSNHEIECGDSYRITYEDKQGVWRVLPIHTTFNSIAYVIQPGQSFRFKAHLNPNVLPNQPGRYRFFYEVRLADTNQKIKLMTEFRLADITDKQSNFCTPSI